jgi:hypothetical protein
MPWRIQAVEAELSAVAVVCGGRALVRGVEPSRTGGRRVCRAAGDLMRRAWEAGLELGGAALFG